MAGVPPSRYRLLTKPSLSPARWRTGARRAPYAHSPPFYAPLYFMLARASYRRNSLAMFRKEQHVESAHAVVDRGGVFVLFPEGGVGGPPASMYVAIM